MTVNLKFVQTPAVALYASVAPTDTTIRITPYPVDLDGNNLVMTDFGSLGYFTIDPKISGYEEIISFTGITNNGDGTATLTGLTRDLQSKYPYTGTGTGKSHGSGAIIVFSDNPQIFGRFAGKDNDETITGNWTFNTAPVALSATPATTTSLGNVRTSVTPSTVLGNPTITIASPAVVTLVAHGLTVNDSITFSTTGALPTGITPGTTYYVISTGLTSNAFEISLTVGGTAVTTTGTQSGTHTVTRTTAIAVENDDPRLPTQNEANALAGTVGPVSSTNKLISQAGASLGATDQSQVTQNATTTVGQTDSSGNHLKIAQSFIPAKTIIRSVDLYKAADTGSFVGTVTVSIQADSTGSPSGTPLATKTITNPLWLAYPTGDFLAIFTSELTVTIGNTYWIVIETSTNDSSNHPNIGTSSGGGYASGSVMAKNTTDGWFAVVNIDLYFKVNEGLNGKVILATASGQVPTLASKPIIKTGIFTFSSTNFTITHGLGKVPSVIRATTAAGTSALGSFAMGTYDVANAVYSESEFFYNEGTGGTGSSNADRICSTTQGSTNGFNATVTITGVDENVVIFTLNTGSTGSVAYEINA